MTLVRSYRNQAFIAACLVASVAPAADARQFKQFPSRAFQKLSRRRAPIRNWKDPSLGIYREGTPKAGADPESLLRYWASQPTWLPPRWGALEEPSESTRKELQAAVKKHPEFLASILRYLPEDPDTLSFVNALLERATTEKLLDEPTVQAVRDWLMMRGPLFRDALLDRAQRDASVEGSLGEADALRALCKLDWNRADLILQRMEEGKDLRLRARALQLRYQHALIVGGQSPQDIRLRLMEIAEELTAPAFARNTAFETLLDSNWGGRDEWYLKQFKDPSLLKLEEENTVYSPLRSPVSRDPNHWIPILTNLINNPDRTIHLQAANLLAEFNLEDARTDALRPLLPWLTEPGWAQAYEGEYMPRLRLIQSLDRVDLPESIPGLLWILDHAVEPFELEAAAEGIARHRDPRGGPAIQRAMKRLKDEDLYPTRRLAMLKSINQCGGFSTGELADLVESYARWKYRTKKGPMTQALGLPESGRVLIWDLDIRNALAPELLRRLHGLEGRDPNRSRAIWALIQGWDTPKVESEKLRRLEAGTVDTDLVADLALKRRGLSPESHRILTRISTGRDWRCGVAAALLESAVPIQSLLASGSPEARIALLSTARAGLIPLPIPEVARLARSKNPRVSQCADRYLESMDTPEAREAYWSLHPGEVRIIGMPSETAFFTGSTQRWEERLRREMLRDRNLEEIVAVEVTSNWGQGATIVVRRTALHTLLTSSNLNGREKREEKNPGKAGVLLSEATARALFTFLGEHEIDNLPPLEQSIYDAPEWTYLHLTRKGGKRIYMNFPQSQPTTPYGRMADAIQKLMPEGDQKAVRPVAYTSF